MKNKIKAALQQKYPQLGLADEVFERVASAVETLIKDEANIPAFVDGAEGMLKQYQSIADRTRGELAETKRELEALKAKQVEKKDEHTETQKTAETKQAERKSETKQTESAAKDDRFDQLLNELKTLREEMSSFKGEQAQKIAVKTAKEKFFANDYAKKYETERDDAWERAIEKFEDTGSKMNADELHDTVMGYFNKYVSRKGVDTKVPFKSEGGSDTENFAAFDRVVAKENEKK